MRVSGCKNHYEFVLGAGAKAKSVTNNLPILSVLATGLFISNIHGFNYCLLSIEYYCLFDPFRYKILITKNQCFKLVTNRSKFTKMKPVYHLSGVVQKLLSRFFGGKFSLNIDGQFVKEKTELILNEKSGVSKLKPFLKVLKSRSSLRIRFNANIN